MRDSGQHSLAIAASVILATIATLSLAFSHDDRHLNPDTAQALSVARNFRQGNGFATGIIYYEEHYQLDKFPAPQTVFPIGFPILISAVGMFGVPLRLAAFLLSVAGFLAIPPLIAAASLRMGQKPVTAVLLATVWLCFPMNWESIRESQSDILFTALTMASFLQLQPKELTSKQLLLSGVFAATAFSVRYAGIFWLITVGLYFVARMVQRQKGSFTQSIMFFSIPVVTVLLLFSRNAYLVGELKGGNNNSGQPFFFAVMESYFCLSRITGLDQDDLLGGHLAEILTATGAAIVFGIAVCSARQVRRSDFALSNLLRIAEQSTAAMYVIVTIAVLIGLETMTSIHLSPRMFYPAIPFALLAAADLLCRLHAAFSNAPRLQKYSIVPASGMIVAGLLFGQLQSADEVASQIHRFGLVADRLERPVEAANGSVDPLRLITNGPILTNEPHMLGEYLERGAIGLTDSKYTSRVWTDDAVIALIQKYGVNQIVLFPDLPTTEENPFFNSLGRFVVGHEHQRSWMIPLVISPQIEIYDVNLVPAQPGQRCRDCRENRTSN